MGTPQFADGQSFKSRGAFLLLCHQNETYCIYRYEVDIFMPDKNNQRHFFEMVVRWISMHTHRAALHDPVHVVAFASSYLERQMWDHQ